MKHYKQLTREPRYQIYGLKQAGLNQTEIAQKTGVDKGTISRKFKLNAGKNGAARSRTVSALTSARGSSRKKHARVIGKATL